MIIAVAIRLTDHILPEEHSLPAPARHNDLIHRMAAGGVPTPITGEQGFVDNKRGFVDRVEAAVIALAEGQVEKLHAPPSLFSEDLW